MPKSGRDKFNDIMDLFVRNNCFEYIDDRDLIQTLIVWWSISDVIDISIEWEIWVKQMINYGVANGCFTFPDFPALEWLLILYDMLETNHYQRITLDTYFFGDYLVYETLYS